MAACRAASESVSTTNELQNDEREEPTSAHRTDERREVGIALKLAFPPTTFLATFESTTAMADHARLQDYSAAPTRLYHFCCLTPEGS